ncbi:MAG: acylphosphatase [Candidatus Altiarchaeota archaeon]|nr:acylphosphatase [Candidatus Altiarchaeota archaeon]
MAMERARIIVRGEVQGVGYRGVVKKIARKLNITGRIQNIKPYDVEITAEGEKKDLDTFIEQIKIREFPIDVGNVDVTPQEATKEFQYFEVVRGDLGEEMGERFDLARMELSNLHEAQKTMIGKQGEMIGKQGEMIGKQGEMIGKQGEMIGKQDQTLVEIKTMRVDMNQNFNALDTKYGSLSDRMSSIDNTLKELTQSILALVGKKT